MIINCIYLQYLHYVLIYKWNVLIEAWKMGMFWHGLVHDLSKLYPSEFGPYARYFYGLTYVPPEKAEVIRAEFNLACLHHHNRNKHHWHYWVDEHGWAHPMPMKYVKQMVVDWRAMGRRMGDTASKYFHEHKDNMMLHPTTIDRIKKYI